jgi:hypothetical protein
MNQLTLEIIGQIQGGMVYYKRDNLTYFMVLNPEMVAAATDKRKRAIPDTLMPDIKATLKFFHHVHGKRATV